jgi:hypothetical protein
MAQLTSFSDGDGRSASETPLDTTDLVFGATFNPDKAPASVHLEMTFNGGQDWLYVTGSRISKESGVVSIDVPDGAELAAVVASGGEAKTWLEGSNF